VRWFIYPFDPILEDNLGYYFFSFGPKFVEIRKKFNEVRVMTVLYNIQNLQSHEILFYNRHEMPRIYIIYIIRNKDDCSKRNKKTRSMLFFLFFSRESQKRAW
jgi:hypothetical protein